MAKPRIALPVIVEGKYDKITILSYFDADVFVTGGFSIFNAKEKQALFLAGIAQFLRNRHVASIISGTAERPSFSDVAEDVFCV